MDIQLKKGLLDICILKCISIEDSYGYKIITDLEPYLEISESTLYPILKRLEENGFVDVYKEEHNSRLRKYFKITIKGNERLIEFKDEAKNINKILNYILGGVEND